MVSTALRLPELDPCVQALSRQLGVAGVGKNAAVPVPDDIVPEDSFVLDLWSDENELAVLVEAALALTHPSFYWPPRPGEQHAYAQLLVRLRGDVQWRIGPKPKRAVDAFGQPDFGDLGSWWTDDEGVEHVEGEWGVVVVTNATQSVEVRAK